LQVPTTAEDVATFAQGVTGVGDAVEAVEPQFEAAVLGLFSIQIFGGV
jgi:hypothetical protein